MKDNTILWVVIGGIALFALAGGAAVTLNQNEGSSNDPINAMALAIQSAEGYYPGSRSYRNNNPGNLKTTSAPGQTGVDSGGFAIFDSYADGFAALENQLSLAFNNQSSIYNSGMTISQFFALYSGDQNEANNVAAALGVPVTTTLDQLAANASGGTQA
jgi:hypothetical protein